MGPDAIGGEHSPAGPEQQTRGWRRASTLPGPRASMAALRLSSVRGGRVLMARSGKAAVFRGPGKPSEVREGPLAALVVGEGMVRVVLLNVCGSGVDFWGGDLWQGLPPVV